MACLARVAALGNRHQAESQFADSAGRGDSSQNQCDLRLILYHFIPVDLAKTDLDSLLEQSSYQPQKQAGSAGCADAFRPNCAKYGIAWVWCCRKMWADKGLDSAIVRIASRRLESVCIARPVFPGTIRP